MVGNFHGVLILCLWLIWHPQKLMPVQLPTTGANGGGGVAKVSWKLGQLFSMLASNDCYYRQADGVLDSNGFLVCVICPCRSDSAIKEVK